MGKADLIADRLRREADRVASVATVRAQVETLQASLAENDRDKAVLGLRARELDASWRRGVAAGRHHPAISKGNERLADGDG